MSDHSHGSRPAADVSARVAWADDAEAIAALQVRAWQSQYADLLPAEVLPQDPAPLAEQWKQSLTRPEDARQRVLVALERNRVVGFVLTSPATDPDSDPIRDAEVSEITVDPREYGKGHGSRLVHAAVDTLVADKFSRATTWVRAGDDAMLTFLGASGWAPDTAHRQLDLDGTGTTLVKQVRLHTNIGE